MSESKYINPRFLSAVRDGNLEAVRNLIRSFGLPYLQQGYGGYVLLGEAIKCRHRHIAKLLLDNGSKVNSNEMFVKTPLYFAVMNNDIEIVKMLLNVGADMNARNANGCTVLHDAIEGYDTCAISDILLELLLDKGADVNAKNNQGKTPLHIASKKQCSNVVEILLKYGANVNSQVNSTYSMQNSDEGYTPLHYASEQGNEEVVKLVLSRGADVNAKTKENVTPLHVTVKKGYVQVLRMLLEHGADVNAQDKDGKSILHYAADKQNLMIIEDFMKYFSGDFDNINEQYQNIIKSCLRCSFIHEYKENPELLYVAIIKRYDYLLKFRADINIHNSTLEEVHTFLQNAFKNKQHMIINLLVHFGANINAKDDSTKTPIMYAVERAVENYDLEILKILLQCDADINASDKYGCTALHFTALYHEDVTFPIQNNNKHLDDPKHFLRNADIEEDIVIYVRAEIAELLLKSGANVDAKTKDGNTTLHIAIQNRYTEVVEALLKFNADVNLVGKNGLIPLYFYAQEGNELICNMILSCLGADVNVRQKDGVTPLYIASYKGHLESVKVLLKFGAEVDFTDESGRTALHMACIEGHAEVAHCLLEYGADINIANNNNQIPFDCVYFETCRQPAYKRKFFRYRVIAATYDVLNKHMVKLKTACFYVREPIRKLNSTETNEYFQNKCDAEIEIMKGKKINNTNVSVYDILRKSTVYARNENFTKDIINTLESDDFKINFPIYASMINSRFKIAVEKKKLLEELDQGSKFFYFLKSLPKLPIYCTEEILSYLSNKDLRILIDICKSMKRAYTCMNNVENVLDVKRRRIE